MSAFRSRYHRRGVSLAEMLVVVVIVGILTSVAVTVRSEDRGGVTVRRAGIVAAQRFAAALAWGRQQGTDVYWHVTSTGYRVASRPVGASAVPTASHVSALGPGAADQTAGAGAMIPWGQDVVLGAPTVAAVGPDGAALPGSRVSTWPGDTVRCRPNGSCSAPVGSGGAVYLRTVDGLKGVAVTTNHLGRVRAWVWDGAAWQ